MPAPATALRLVEQPIFRTELAKYVAAVCRHFRVKRQDVNDLVQEVLTEVVASIGTYQPEKSPLDKWARGVARNVIYRYLRDAMRFVARFSENHPNANEYAAGGPSPEWCVRRLQARCQLSSATDGLTEEQWQVFMLHVVDDMSHAEIGKELGISEAASQKRYQRARDHLAECIKTSALSVMPPVETSCNDAPSSNHGAWHWIQPEKLSHYTGQITGAIIAFLLFVPTRPPVQPRTESAGGMQAYAENAMYRRDKLSVTADKPIVFPDTPTGKPIPASLPSIRVMSAPKRLVDKPGIVRQPATPPTFKPTAPPVIHRPPVRRIKP